MKNINKKYRQYLKYKYFKKRLKKIANECNGFYFDHVTSSKYLEPVSIKSVGWQEFMKHKSNILFKTSSTPRSYKAYKEDEKYNRAKEKEIIYYQVTNY